MARKGKGKEAKLSYNGNLLVENRHGLIVNSEVFEANGTAERVGFCDVQSRDLPGTHSSFLGSAGMSKPWKHYKARKITVHSA
jgi:hypothetical protein